MKTGLSLSMEAEVNPSPNIAVIGRGILHMVAVLCKP